MINDKICPFFALTGLHYCEGKRCKFYWLEERCKLADALIKFLEK